MPAPAPEPRDPAEAPEMEPAPEPSEEPAMAARDLEEESWRPEAAPPDPGVIAEGTETGNGATADASARDAPSGARRPPPSAARPPSRPRAPRRDEVVADEEIVTIGTRNGASADDEPTGSADDTAERINEVVVYYGTDRARSEPCAGEPIAPTPDCKTVDFYTGSRGELEVGALTVTIPRDEHERGDIERPFTWWKIKFPEDPEKHIILSEIEPVPSRSDWQAKIQASGADEGFLYVHGYSTSFESAAYRAAQIAYDLDYKGLPLFYSWPSQGNAPGYFTDGEVVELSNDPFIDFLLLAKESGLNQLHLVAHSMGNRLVAKALNTLVQRGESRELVSELVLAAPDIDAERFREEFAEVLPRLARRATLYVSDQDRALAAAEGIRERPRAGQTAGKLLGLAGFDSIDASKLKLDFLAHSYYANNLNMLADIYCVLVGSVPEERPLLAPITGDEGPAWQIQPFEALGSIRPDPALCEKEVALVGEGDENRGLGGIWWLVGLLLLLAATVGVYLLRRSG